LGSRNFFSIPFFPQTWSWYIDCSVGSTVDNFPLQLRKLFLQSKYFRKKILKNFPVDTKNCFPHPCLNPHCQQWKKFSSNCHIKQKIINFWKTKLFVQIISREVKKCCFYKPPWKFLWKFQKPLAQIPRSNSREFFLFFINFIIVPMAT